MMHLRPDLELAFAKKLASFEKDSEMPYVTSVERYLQAQSEAEDEARGRARRQADLIVRILKQKCGRLPARVRKQLEQLLETAANNLCDVYGQIRTVSDLEEWLSQHAGESS